MTPSTSQNLCERVLGPSAWEKREERCCGPMEKQFRVIRFEWREKADLGPGKNRS